MSDEQRTADDQSDDYKRGYRAGVNAGYMSCAADCEVDRRERASSTSSMNLNVLKDVNHGESKAEPHEAHQAVDERGAVAAARGAAVAEEAEEARAADAVTSGPNASPACVLCMVVRCECPCTTCAGRPYPHRAAPRPCVHGAWNADGSCCTCGAKGTAPWYRHAVPAETRSSGLADPYREAHDHYARQMSKKYYDDHEPSWDELDEDERMAWRAGFEMYVKSGGT